MSTTEKHILFLPDLDDKEEPRVLGLAMVPGQHIVSIEIDDPER